MSGLDNKDCPMARWPDGPGPTWRTLGTVDGFVVSFAWILSFAWVFKPCWFKNSKLACSVLFCVNSVRTDSRVSDTHELPERANTHKRVSKYRSWQVTLTIDSSILNLYTGVQMHRSTGLFCFILEHLLFRACTQTALQSFSQMSFVWKYYFIT